MKKQFFFIIFIILFFVESLHSEIKAVEDNGIVNDNAVRVRTQPTLEATIIGRLDKGMAVSIFGRTNERMFLDGYDSYWLKISQDNIEGWVYGAYINLTNSLCSRLPVLSDIKPKTGVDLNYRRDIPEQELIKKERETLMLQSDRFMNLSVKEYYDEIVKVFNQKQSLRPFFLNTQMIVSPGRDVFFYLSSSNLCDYIQASYFNNIIISPLNSRSDISAVFMISGFEKPSDFFGPQIVTMAINIKKIEGSKFAPLNGKTVIDYINISPYSLKEIVQIWGETDYHSFMTSGQIYLHKSPFLEMILNEK